MVAELHVKNRMEDQRKLNQYGNIIPGFQSEEKQIVSVHLYKTITKDRTRDQRNVIAFCVAN